MKVFEKGRHNCCHFRVAISDPGFYFIKLKIIVHKQPAPLDQTKEAIGVKAYEAQSRHDIHSSVIGCCIPLLALA